MEPARAEEIAAACAELRTRGPYPEKIARGLAADDPDEMRAAVGQLIETGRVEGLRDLVERFRDKSDLGVWARITSSQLYRAAGDYAAGLADIEDLARFPHRAAAHWGIAKARCLDGLGRTDDAVAAVREAISRFPGSELPPAFLANLLSRHKRYVEALEAWRDAHARFPRPDVSWFVGLANALRALDRVDEAFVALEDGARRFPDNVAVLRERASMALDLGESARARDLLLRLTATQPDASRPEWWAQLARAHHDLREYEAGARALEELEARFPESALGEGERFRLAKEQDYGLERLHALTEAALRRFPRDFNLRAHGVWMLLCRGLLAQAEREVEALEAEGAPGFALAARLRLEADRGDASLRACAERFAEAPDSSLPDAIQVAYALLDARAPWAFALGGDVVERAARRFPGNIRLNHLHIRLMIARREDEAALRLIDAIPARYVRREFLELRAWAAAKRGRDAEAKRHWAQALEENYYAAVHAPVGVLERVSPDDRPGPEAGPTAYVVFRNEAAQMPGFLAHHRRLGVRRFVFFDHLSDDGGRALALAEPDVVLYHCPGSYQLSWSGRRWVNEIVAHEGARGWGLQLDMDERLVYPGCETLPLDRFVAYLDAHGFEGVRGYMLDVFPPRLLDEGGAAAPFSAHRWYDDDYELIGIERAPYLQPSGGVRARLFEAKEFLHKTPLWRLDAGVLINSHETTHLRMADVSTALLHYKLMNVALRGAREAPGAGFLEADADVEAIRRHSRYAARLDALWRRDLVAPGISRELEDSLTLAGRGLMDMSEAFRRWLRGAA